MLSSYSANVRLIIQRMFASEYVLALSRSEDRFCRLIQLNIKVEGRLQWAIENPPKCFLSSVWKTQNRLLTCRVVIYYDMLSLQVMTSVFGGLKTVSFFGFISYSNSGIYNGFI